MRSALAKRSDRGSAAIETVVGLPVFVLFIGLIVFGGRTATTQSALESAAADAARNASIARTSGDARFLAEGGATASLANQGIDCLSVRVAVDVSEFRKPVGQPASVTATIECRLDLSDLSVPGVPGSRWLSATSTSPLDTWRERG